MEQELVYDTPDLIVGQITALKLLNYADRDAAAQIS
jgi:hypothetical protein